MACIPPNGEASFLITYSPFVCYCLGLQHHAWCHVLREARLFFVSFLIYKYLLVRHLYIGSVTETTPSFIANKHAGDTPSSGNTPSRKTAPHGRR